MGENYDLAGEENNRFTQKNALFTLFILSTGALIATFGQGVLESVDLIFISKRFQNEKDSYAVQIIGIGYYIVLTCYDVCLFMGQTIVARVSGLIGEGRRDDATQLVVDVYRLSLFSTIFVQIIMIFCSRSIMLFAGCSLDLIEQCTLLVSSTITALPFIALFHISTSFIQSIGKSILNGVVYFFSSMMQTFVFTPLLQFVFKIDVTLSNLSQVAAQAIIGVVLFVLIMKKKFTIQPSFDLFFKPFSKELKRALLNAVPIIPCAVYIIIPPVLLLKFMTDAAASINSNQLKSNNLYDVNNVFNLGNDELIKDIIAVFTVFQKTILICSAAPVALCSGLLSSGTHSYGCRNIKRLMSTFSWCYSISFIVLIFFSGLMILAPNAIADLFVKEESTRILAKKFLPIPFYTFTFQTICVTSTFVLIVLRHPNISTFCNVMMIVLVCVAAKIINMMYPNDPLKVLYAYTITDVLSFLITSILAGYYIYQVRKEYYKDPINLKSQQLDSVSVYANLS